MDPIATLFSILFFAGCAHLDQQCKKERARHNHDDHSYEGGWGSYDPHTREDYGYYDDYDTPDYGDYGF